MVANRKELKHNRKERKKAFFCHCGVINFHFLSNVMRIILPEFDDMAQFSLCHGVILFLITSIAALAKKTHDMIKLRDELTR
jgi:hypothetical protein